MGRHPGGGPATADTPRLQPGSGSGPSKGPCLLGSMHATAAAEGHADMPICGGITPGGSRGGCPASAAGIPPAPPPAPAAAPGGRKPSSAGAAATKPSAATVPPTNTGCGRPAGGGMAAAAAAAAAAAVAGASSRSPAAPASCFTGSGSSCCACTQGTQPMLPGGICSPIRCAATAAAAPSTPSMCGGLPPACDVHGPPAASSEAATLGDCCNS